MGGIVLTGGLGFIGSRLLRLLLDESSLKINIIDDAIGRSSFDFELFKILANPRIVWHPESVLDDQNFLAKLVENCVVVHLGAVASTDTSIKFHHMANANYARIMKLMIECNKSESKFIFASSAAVYGNTQSAHSFGYPLPVNAYGLSKLKLEQYAESLSGLNYTCLRLFNVYGPGESHKGNMISVPAALFSEYKSRKAVTVYTSENENSSGLHTTASRDFIHVDDVCRTIFFLVKSHNFGSRLTLDLGSGESVSILQIAQIVVGESNYDSIVFRQFPGSTHGYQMFTRANMEVWEKLGMPLSLTRPQDGILEYLSFLKDRIV